MEDSIPLGAVFEDLAAGEDKWVGGGIEEAVGGGHAADSDRAGDVVEVTGVVIYAHRAAVCVDLFVIRAARQMKVSVGVDFARRLVVGDLVGVDDIFAVLDFYTAGEGPNIATLGLFAGGYVDWISLWWRGNYLGSRDGGRVGILGVDGVRHCGLGGRCNHLAGRGKLVRQRLRGNLLMTQDVQRDTPTKAGRHFEENIVTLRATWQVVPAH